MAAEVDRGVREPPKIPQRFSAVLWIIPGDQVRVDRTVLCITIIGIPFGIQSIKMAGLALQPFGKKIIRSNDAGAFYSST